MVAPTSFFADYGCHVRILEEARVLQALGHRVTIVTYARGRDLPDVTIRRTPPLPYHADYEVGSSRHKFAFDAYLAPTVLQAAREVRPDVVHGHLHEGALIGYPAARLLGIPLVFDYQGSMTGEMIDHQFLHEGSVWTRLARWGEERINRLADAVITSSIRAAEHYAAHTPGRVARPVPDVVNPHVFRPDILTAEERAAARATLGIPAEAEVVVYLGLLAPYQGTDQLLRAAARVCAVRPRAHFLVMGYPNLERYREMAAALGVSDRVTFLGRVPYDEAPQRLALGDIAAAPKLSITEGAGKLLTYMSMALPTVAYDMPVSHEYLGGDGVYATRGDADAFADRLLDVLADPGRGERGARLRAHVMRAFAWEDLGHALAQTYAAVLARKPAAAARPAVGPAASISPAQRVRPETGRVSER